jgi:hypothetical protein
MNSLSLPIGSVADLIAHDWRRNNQVALFLLIEQGLGLTRLLLYIEGRSSILEIDEY